MTPTRQDKWDRRFLRLAEHIAGWSQDPSTKTGAVIVDEHNRVVSTGYNGFPKSMPDYPEWYFNRDEKYSRIVHCEMNAILFAHRDLSGFTLYTWPLLSCDRCFVFVAQAGIRRCVAPVLTDPGLIERWGPQMTKVRGYAQEMSIEMVEIRLA